MLSHIQTKKPSKNRFDLSYPSKITGNMGVLYPCYLAEVVPGDSFRVDTSQMVRFSPLLAPAYENIDIKLDYFFIPYRLVWDEWKDFITGGEDGNDLPSFPRFPVTQQFRDEFLKKNDLLCYMGVPPAIDTGEAVTWEEVPIDDSGQHLSLLQARAYQLTHHEYFRDQNVGTEYEQYRTSGIEDNLSNLRDQLTIRRTSWEKDYFTSALPFLQRGSEVTLPLGNIAPVVVNEDALPGVGGTNFPPVWRNVSDGSTAQGSLVADNPSGITETPINNSVYLDPNTSLEVDLQNATAATINELRKASALQEWLELMARAGSRYREQIYAMFGERIPDYTVQVPQYLGGGRTPVMISEVLSTYQNNDSANPDRPQGDMTGHAIATGSNIGFQQNFQEHGVVLGLVRVVPRTTYVQGLPRFWTKFDKFDYYFPHFAHLGEQEILNKELFVLGSGDDGDDGAIFGYQQRYAEYKYAKGMIAGDFYDNLAFWELSRRFPSVPVLNQSFIECNPDKRIFAIEDPDEDSLWMFFYHKVDALRPIPYFSNPTLT